jgi:hypothetical protein
MKTKTSITKTLLIIMLIISVFPILAYAYDIDYRLPGDSSGTDYAVIK